MSIDIVPGPRQYRLTCNRVLTSHCFNNSCIRYLELYDRSLNRTRYQLLQHWWISPETRSATEMKVVVKVMRKVIKTVRTVRKLSWHVRTVFHSETVPVNLHRCVLYEIYTP